MVGLALSLFAFNFILGVEFDRDVAHHAVGAVFNVGLAHRAAHEAVMPAAGTSRTTEAGAAAECLGGDRRRGPRNEAPVAEGASA